MIEESYVRLYAGDFARLAARAEVTPLDPAILTRRMKEARVHAGVMDARKGDGHLEALVTRLRDEARRPRSRGLMGSIETAEANAHHHAFLTTVADALSVAD
ncbi:MAG: hypothetical protein EBR82_20320 [Caulobacteraceae bacterium]|nr:hypothetical protein [Caulobacteraceae bacterium]